MCDALHYLLDNIFIRFGSKLYRKIVGIPMGTNCAPLVADLFLFCYERDFMLSLSDNYQADIIEAFNSTSRYLDDLLNIDNPYFEQMVGQIYPTELQLNKANSSDTEAPFLDLNLSITNGIVSSKIDDKQDDCNFEIVNFQFLDGDVRCSPSYGVYISQLIRFARMCSNSSIGATIAPMTSRRQIQDGGPHDFRSKMAAPTTSDQRWRPPTTSDPIWRPPRRQIQDGGPHDFRSKMAAPTKSDTRWRPL